MAETAKYPVGTKLGCGLMGGIFPSRRNLWPRKTSSVPSLPTNTSNITIKVPAATTHNPKNRRRGGSRETAFLESSNLVKQLPKPSDATTRTSTSSSVAESSRPRRELRCVSSELNGMSPPKPLEATRNSTSSSITDLNQPPRELSGITTELNGMINNNHAQQSNGSGALFRSTSSNVMLLGHLGNLRSQFPPGPSSGLTHKNGNSKSKLGCNGNAMMGNIVRKAAAAGGGNENQRTGSWYGGSMMNRILDPEVMKCMGNEEYKMGRFEEALCLYNKAIALDSSKASYHSNKGAALTGLGRLIEAVFECREAIRIEPFYHRAHHRLATLYLRMGEAEKALCHYKYSCPKADSEYIAQAQALQTHLSRCTEAYKLRDWNTMLKQTHCAVSSGADSAPEIYAWQAEALLKLHRHQEAYDTFRKGPNFDLDSLTQIFGPARTSYLLMIQAQLFVAMGRFEDAIVAAQHAARLDSTNKEVSAVSRRIRAVASARLRGNQLFKASKFSEACVVYCEGLEHDPYNSLLLCNRAACRSKLGQFEKAIEDCSAALDVRPSYSKARLRRAGCNAKVVINCCFEK